MPANILVVEDDPILRDRIAEALSACTVARAEDGEAAIEHLWSGSFDAIVLDLMLPRLSGYDVIRHLSMRNPELLAKTIVITGAGDTTLGFLKTHEVYAILRKPFALDELGTMIAALLAR